MYAWGLGQFHDEEEEQKGEDDLEGDGKAPGDSAWFKEGESKIEPVA